MPDEISTMLKEYKEATKTTVKEPPKTVKELEQALIQRGIEEREKREYAVGKGENVKVKKPRLTPLEVAHILQEYIPFVIIDKIDNPVSMYLIDEGIYTTKEAYFFKVISYLENTLIKKTAENVLFHLKNEAAVKEKYRGNQFICVGNGIYNALSNQLEEYRPDLLFTSKIATNYREVTSEPERTGWKFSEMVKDWSNDDEELELLFWQIIRASVQLKNREQFVLLRDSGGGRTGKGTFEEFIASLIGKENTMALTVTEMTQSHQLQGIDTAQVVIGDDNDSSSFINEPRVLKSLVTGDSINVNPKNQPRFSYQGTPLVIQSINGHLRTTDVTGAFKRRMLIVPFVKSFKGGKGNPRIKNEYAHDKEILEGIMYQALQLEDFTLFIQPKASEKVLHEFTLENDVVADFYENVFQHFQSGRLRVDFVYTYFVQWSRMIGKPSKLSQRMFVSRLNEFIAKSRDWRHTGQQALQVLDYFIEEDNLIENEPFIEELTYIQDRYRKARKTCYVNTRNEEILEVQAIEKEIGQMERTAEAMQSSNSNMKLIDVESHEKQLAEMKKYKTELMQLYSLRG